ncbi:hypothetical protein YOLOSWAG_103 [Erwinia phage vB_EamM_Yoloswag]|uniref:Uncharacterized protein n=1 Tax=Erwinia phage vB_EamM_Yoloswag TaxID=1958956 RepID=A0A1S6L325_9CAUD|nr:hypothetical protein HOR66_gp103 [Erwinia phage vB_EamM_Yoloswag]AQT28585.1 hypothetical protein YOLOSWAG_103 [Erwinia phage vB_EamM_Yoloswag]
MAATSSIYVDALRLTSQGEQAVADANSGGIAVQPVAFKVGDFVGAEPSDVPEQLLGNELASGKLSYVQVLTENSARFIFDVKLTFNAGDDLKQIGEILILLKDNRAFGHVVLNEPIIAVPNAVTRISLLVHIQQDIQKILAVEMYDYATVPSVATLDNLPSLNDNQFNVVSVLDLHTNSDGTSSPGTASRYGAGGYYWAFSEHDRVYADLLGTAFINANTFKIANLSLKQGETVIVQTVSGPGAGACRHFKYDKTGQLVNQGQAIPFISAQTTVAVWQRITNPITPTPGIPWPLNNDVPTEWMLCRGENDEPYWAPNSSSARQSTATLFTPPGKLQFSSVVTTAVPEQLVYALTEDVDSATDLFVGTSGILQPRTAYLAQGTSMQLSGSVPESITLDLRQFRLEPTQGHVVLFDVIDTIGDGQTDTFNLGTAVDSADHVFAIVGNTWQPSISYKINNGNSLAFVESIPSGIGVSLYCARYEERQGWSTRIRVAQYTFPFQQDTFILPITPVSKAYCVVNVGGVVAHYSEFSLVTNTLKLSTPIEANTLVEITVFENVKSVGSKESSIDGVIIDVVPTPNGYMFKRQGQTPVVVPMPVPTMIQGKGIRIDGVWPEVTIVNTQAEAASVDPKAVYNIQNVEQDTEELVITQRIEFKKELIITASADFACQLGPGFAVTSGKEHIEFVVGVKTPGSPEAAYARGLKGTGSAGFNVVDTNGTEAIAYANASLTQMFNITIENQPQGYVEIVAKVRVTDSQVSAYSSKLIGNLCIKVEPR